MWLAYALPAGSESLQQPSSKVKKNIGANRRKTRPAADIFSNPAK
jgi:hypothetical protein